jgi:hypothetical protein
MRIDRKLNFVVPIVDENDQPYAYVHSTPISTEVFDKYFLPLARTYSAIFALGLGPIAGPRVADKLLKKTSMDIGIWEGAEGVQAGLVSEIHRLTNVVTIGKAGWETVPWGFAKQNKLLSDADIAEVEAAICFFTLTSAVHPKNKLAEYLQVASSLWGGQTTSLNSTEFANSLPISTATANTGATAAA